jgi:hypothetical protein
MAAAHHGGVEDWYARAIAFALRASRIGSNRIRPFGAWFSAWLQMATCRMISTTTASSARHVHLLRGIRNMCVPKPSSNDDDNTKQHRNSGDTQKQRVRAQSHAPLHGCLDRHYVRGGVPSDRIASNHNK